MLGFDREEDLRKAIALSEEEEAKRKKALEDANAKALFDDSQQTYVPTSRIFTEVLIF